MQTNLEINNLTDGIKTIISAINFAAQKHKVQRRKGGGRVPFVNHPIEITNLLAQTVKPLNINLLVAAVLHDTIEDTDTTAEELEAMFGKEVSGIVCEVTDDMNLSKPERKDQQLVKASGLSDNARLIKIADKRCNILDMIKSQGHWTKKQKVEYIRWAKKVAGVCQGISEELDNEFDKAYLTAKQTLGFN